jgi:hypothetical protein
MPTPNCMPRLALLALTICLAAPASGARAGILLSLSATTSPSPGGRTLYEYTLWNQEASTVPIAALGIYVDAPADLADIVGPTGWDVDYSRGDTSIYWASSDERYDLQPGATALFQFTSALPAVTQPFEAMGFDAVDGSLVLHDGETHAPGVASAVPEPAGIVSLGLGALVLVGYLARTRRRSRCWRWRPATS